MAETVVVDTHHHYLPPAAVTFAKKTDEIDYLFGSSGFPSPMPGCRTRRGP